MLYWLTRAVTALGVRYAPPGAITVAPSPPFTIHFVLALLCKTSNARFWIMDYGL